MNFTPEEAAMFFARINHHLLHNRNAIELIDISEDDGTDENGESQDTDHISIVIKYKNS